MADGSKIEWTDNTANFWWGCFKVSPGCTNCYADTLANRWGKSIWGPAKTTDRELKKGVWAELPKWNERAKASGKRERVFVMSMGDFFEDHPQVTEWRDKALALIQECKHLDFQVLTKRPENVVSMIECANSHSFSDAEMWFYANPHVWIGTSVEDQEQADKRIPELLRIPAAVRFLSMEPLLGPVDLRGQEATERGLTIGHDWLTGEEWQHSDIFGGGKDIWKYDPEFDEYGDARIHWVIVGGESGHGKRPFNPDWARAIRDQCAAAGVPFFMKQWDKVKPIPDDLMIREFPVVQSASVE